MLPGDDTALPLLYVCSNFSRILPGLNRTVTGFSVRRGFTGDQVSAIISGCDATYLFVEHDPSLYEDDTRLIPVVVNKIRAFARENGTVIIYSEGTDRFMRQVMRAAHRYTFMRNGEISSAVIYGGSTIRVMTGAFVHIRQDS